MTLTATSPEILEFIEAYQENRNLAVHGPSGYRIIAVERRKYIAIDEVPTCEGRDCAGQGGRFMIDRETGVVFTIKGYGKCGWQIAPLADLVKRYRAGSATFTPEARSHWETARSRVATW